MAEQKIFVGRKKEIEQFKKVLEDTQGQAVLVVGHRGMGKTYLINKMGEVAENHPELKCRSVRYEVTPTDSVDSTMALMMDNAFEAASTKPSSFDKVPERKRQWLALLKTVVPKGEQLAELILSLRRDPAKHTRDQFLERLRLVSDRMPENGRAIFIIDPEKYMQEESDQSWAIVVKDLPEKVKFIFAQRTEDVLVGSETFGALKNVVRIPDENLEKFSDKDVDDLLNANAGEIKCSIEDLRKVLKRYDGHPYAVGAAIDLVKEGVELEDLPKQPEPTEFAKAQWKKVCEKGKEAIRLFKAYAILDVGVPSEVVQAAGNIDTDTFQHVLADKYSSGLLREEGYGKRIYHSILADCVLSQISEKEKKKYHARAVKVYRGKLKKAEEEQIKPDELSAIRLAEHVLADEGKKEFVNVFVNECYKALLNLGLLDAAISLSLRALKFIKKGSIVDSILKCNLGIVYKTRGELDKAEEMFKKALEIDERLRIPKGMANNYGNLGAVYGVRGELDKAEQMFKKSLEIDERLGYQKGMASTYGNLGLIYQTRGELDKSEHMLKNALEIAEQLDMQRELANTYSTLGMVYQTRGKLDKAEEMFKKALEIDERLGLQEQLTAVYGNLGIVYQTRGELDNAEQMLKKSLEICERIGRWVGLAAGYGNLGIFYETCGDLLKAEEMYQKALEIDEWLGLQGKLAEACGNLGNVYQKRGELDKAEKMYQKALEIDERLRLQGCMAYVYGNLGLVYKERRDIAKAREYWQKAEDLFKKIGIPDMTEKMQKRIKETEK